jgi:hypothetical protein
MPFTFLQNATVAVTQSKTQFGRRGFLEGSRFNEKIQLGSGRSGSRANTGIVSGHANRRIAGKDSPAFHNLTGAITAYGKALALLTALQQREEFYAVIGESEFSGYAAAAS